VEILTAVIGLIGKNADINASLPEHLYHLTPLIPKKVERSTEFGRRWSNAPAFPGGAESCNCESSDSTILDTHIELTPDATHSGPQFRMIVEVSPRLRMIMKQKKVDWSTPKLKKKILHHKVTIQGWLFYDEIHEEQAFSTNPANPKNWRASCWEIHPITNMQVVK